MMNINARFAEQAQIVPFVMPIDLNSGANAGDWVSMKNFERLTICVLASAGTAANDLTMTVSQAVNVSGGSSKALNAITSLAVKQGASLAAIGQYSEVTQAADEQYTEATNGESQLLYVTDILAEDLDVDNGFDCVQVSLNQVGAAKVGCAFGILWGAKFAGSVDLLPSAIAN